MEITVTTVNSTYAIPNGTYTFAVQGVHPYCIEGVVIDSSPIKEDE